MPIYEYAPLSDACDRCQGRFEVMQSIRDAALTVCPDCGQAVRRMISAPAIASGGSHLLREEHFSKHGFTQYRRVEKGHYEKTAGPGPNTIKDDGG
jgi:putative FmdB family regulatory protein